jgi:hypothetical protein
MNKFPTIIVRFKYHAFSSNFEEMVVNQRMKTSIECGIDTLKYNITKSCEYIFFDSFIGVLSECLFEDEDFYQFFSLYSKCQGHAVAKLPYVHGLMN